MRFTHGIIMFILLGFSLIPCLSAESNQKRNRGEAFYKLLNSNTSGPGNIWITFTGVGFVWDDTPSRDDPVVAREQKWFSNFYAFPEIRAQAGIGEFMTFILESRMLSYKFRFGNLVAGAKFTIPNNKELRLHGFGLDIRFVRQFFESNPTLGGCIGFMPEGFVVEGTSMDAKFLYELDLLPRISKLPLRGLINAGARIPLRSDRLECFQYLFDSGIIYSGYGFDFFLIYSIEAFNNLTKPLIVSQKDGRKFAVFFSENPMYLTLGGNVRYDNGIVLSLAFPLLLSRNKYSIMSREDGERLDDGYYPEELKYGVTDPFDPWFTKWKLAASISFPLRYKMTGAEMMRSFLIMKNRRQNKWMDIDNRLKGADQEQDKKAAPKRKD
ncbi:MAG: hypothetical protein GX089_12570 [Fibrobacter sp.]|jgi:hypothetical protein|nr:hypothetical protein [Fibrobacter sp.]